MYRSGSGSGLKRVALAVACGLISANAAEARQPPPPAPMQGPFDNATLPQPTVPPPTTAPVAAAAVDGSREAQLEARIQQLEAIVNNLQYQINRAGPTGPGNNPNLPPGGVREATGGTGGQTGGFASGPGVPGQSFPPVPPVSNRFNAPATLDNRAGVFTFGPGFQLATDDDEFIMQFHNLTQVDYRGYVPGGEGPAVKSGFFIPRQWWMFNGHITKEIGFFTSIADGIDTITMLDVFMDFNYDRRLQWRLGRFKTPFTYEFFVEPIQGLITPERSLFFNNFAQNRDIGLMPYGQLFTAANGVSKVQYAAGVFNGSRNGYLPFTNSVKSSAYLNFHPFGDLEGSIVENLNVGGSVFFGQNAQAAVPSTFRTLQATSGNAVSGVPFLALHDGVNIQGPMALWDLHVAYFYQQLAVIAEWQSGYQDYALGTSAATRSMHTHVPVSSYYVEAGYLLTGETRSQVGIVKPNRPFSVRPGHFGPGAWEVFGRYDYLLIGDQIFTNGLASNSGNANRVWQSQVGLTWHMNQYVKAFFVWTHNEYNNQVTYAPGKTSSTNNVLWARVQLFF